MQKPDQASPSYYEKRTRIYPREVSGRYQRLRVISVFALLGLYYLTPWLMWDGRQAVLFDLPARKFYVLGLVFWPQDFVYLTGLLIIAALALFLFTAVLGRVWCGYACPQTVWTETFIWIERWIEGSRANQIRLDKGPRNVHRLSKKAAKHFVWIVFSLWTGFTFVGFFTPIAELGASVLSLSLGPWETFWILFYAFATYGNAGWMREQVCIYMCPYARFQSAMFDANTLIVSYDQARGEPRGSRKRGTDLKVAGLGSCVDCTLCVQVCPTGIDIRDGLQYQCISCAACVDVCNDVMDKVGYAKGLIRYTSDAVLEAGGGLKIFRTRTIIYTVLLLGLCGLLVGAISQRDAVALDVVRDRNQLFHEMATGDIDNVYTLKLINKDHVEHIFNVEVHGIEGLRLVSKKSSVRVGAGEVLDFPVRVSAPRASLRARSSDIEFAVSVSPSIRVVEEARFLGPGLDSKR